MIRDRYPGPALDERDKAAGVVAILQDIGSQRETDEALNLVTARLLAVAEYSPIALMIETEPGDVDLANDAFVHLLGLKSAARRSRACRSRRCSRGPEAQTSSSASNRGRG